MRMRTSINAVVCKAAFLFGVFGIFASCSKDEEKAPAASPKISVTVSGSVNRNSVDQFRPDTPILEDSWSIPYNLERTFTIKFPKSLADDELTLIIDDSDISRNPAIVSNQGAKWAVVNEFVGYKDGSVTSARIKPVLSAKYKSYMWIYVDRDVKLDGDLGVFNNIKHAWGATLRKGWNRLTSQEYQDQGSFPYLWYTNAPADDKTTWQWN